MPNIVGSGAKHGVYHGLFRPQIVVSGARLLSDQRLMRLEHSAPRQQLRALGMFYLPRSRRYSKLGLCSMGEVAKMALADRNDSHWSNSSHKAERAQHIGQSFGVCVSNFGVCL
jgi:hypothetical protein